MQLGGSAPKAQVQRALTDAQSARDAKTMLCLRLRRDQMPAVQAALAALPGNVPVYMNLPTENITLLCPRSLWVGDPERAMEALSDELGYDDMKVVRKA